MEVTIVSFKRSIHKYFGIVEKAKKQILFVIVIIPMGNCVGASKAEHCRFMEVTKFKPSIIEMQRYLLKLVYKDLGSRVPSGEVNHQNFLLFFQKNGYWGARLFKEFDTGASNHLTEEQFIKGIAKIFKTSEDKKIQMLFKFFSGSSETKTGVAFSEFLTMLYNYPKENFKKILNDEEFFNRELRKNLVADNSALKGRRLDSICFSGLSQKQFSDTTFRVEESVTACQRIESRMESQILKSIYNKNRTKSTAIKIKVGGSDVEVVTTNIHNLVKKFAISIFKSYDIDIRKGRLQYEDFKDWMTKHKQLYYSYFKGFHSQIWEVDRKTMKPIFSQTIPEFVSEARVYINSSKPQKVVISLLQSVLVVCEEKDLEKPVSIICLDGLSAKQIFEEDKGYGIEISHRDEFYTPKKFYLKYYELAVQWMENLKFYKGCSIAKLYEIGQKIGIGKFSVVYNCKQSQTGQKYAIKVIESGKLEEQARKLISHQSSIMSIVSHPMLVVYKESVVTKTHIYIVTELVEGKDMFEFVKDCKFLSQEQAAIIVKQIIIGVRYLHSLGIVHRDLKPENIMVECGIEQGPINKIKIIDFGFANYLETIRQLPPQEALAGTPNYIAPQSLRLEQEVTEKIDNFAIGSILYFALSGCLPFSGCNMQEILKKTLDGSYQINDKRWRSISSEAKDLVIKLLENDPIDRLSIDEALMHPWFDKFPSSQFANPYMISKQRPTAMAA